MSQDIHERAQELVSASRLQELSPGDRNWLEAHLNSCPACTRYADDLRGIVRMLRTISVMPRPGLVSATQLRVRARAEALRERQERLRPLWIACTVAVLISLVTTPYLWWGLQWLGSTLGLSDAFWVTGFILTWAVPGILSIAVLIADRTHFAREGGF